MNSIQFIGALQVALIYSFVALGVYLSFRTLQFPDMTVDGSFPLGAAVYATLTLMGYGALVATLAAFFAGTFAGLITGLMAVRLKILNLLTGIISMTALYSINLRIMGAPNLSLLSDGDHPVGIFWIQEEVIDKILRVQDYFSLSWIQPTSLFEDSILVFILAIFIGMVFLFLYGLLSSHFGLALRATGSNPHMARAQGISDEKMILFGLALSNGLVALGGSIFAQINRFADVSLGIGTIIIGLAAVIIGETFISSRHIMKALMGVILGTLVYRLIVALALNGSYLGLKASDLNLVTALLVVLAMSLPHIKKRMKAKFGNAGQGAKK